MKNVIARLVARFIARQTDRSFKKALWHLTGVIENIRASGDTPKVYGETGEALAVGYAMGLVWGPGKFDHVSIVEGREIASKQSGKKRVLASVPHAN